VSIISLATTSVSCATAQSPITLAALLVAFSNSSLFSGIPSSWITNSAQCGPGTRRRLQVLPAAQDGRRLQVAPNLAPANTIIFTFTISAPATAPAAQLAAAADAVSSASTTAANVWTTQLQLTNILGQSATITAVGASVDGFVCGASPLPSCESIFFPSPGPTLNVGAVIGGVIGGLAALAIFIALVVAFRLGYCGKQTAGLGDDLAAAAPPAEPADEPQHVSAASVNKPAAV